jgi:DNA-binding response OmpR family regulator
MLVLQVEDDANTAKSVELMLKAEGHDCETAALGEEALRLAQEKDYDLILLDIMLPDIDGYDVLRRLREKDISAPVLIQSGLVDTEEGRAGLGVSESLLKPFDKSELSQRIEAVTGGQRPPAEPETAVTPEPEDSEDGSERRRDTRSKTIKGGEIVYNQSNCIMDCVVISLSDGGAAIQPEDSLILPDQFTLRVRFGPTRDCEVCWRHGNKLGVRFLNN